MSTQAFLEVMDALNKRMEQFEGELQKTPPGHTISGLAAEFAAFKSFTAQILREFQSQLGLLAQSVDDIEMSSRRKILLLHGVPEEEKEDTAALVVLTVTKHLKLESFSGTAISRCQRMGRPRSDRPRPILLKLRENEVRNKLWSSKTSLKGSNFTLSEFLTKARHQAFMEARQCFGVKNCWTRDGYIHILGPDGKRHRITGMSGLREIKLPPPPAPAPPAPAALKKATETGTMARLRRGAPLSSQK